MYRLCMKYSGTKLAALAGQMGYANSDEMCEDLALDKTSLLTHYVPLDITTDYLGHPYRSPREGVVYAVTFLDNYGYEPIDRMTRVWRCHTDDVVWINEDDLLATDYERIIPLRHLRSQRLGEAR